MSGGGAKFLVYLGIIKALTEAGIKIDVIGGLSGGSLIAAGVASGLTTSEITTLATHVNVRSLFDTNPLNGWSVLDRDKLYHHLISILGPRRIENCYPRLVIFTTDMSTKTCYPLTSGEIAAAVVASCGLPMVIKPSIVDGKHLGEGGLSVHYGAKYLRQLGAEVVIGADVAGFSHGKLGGVAEELLQGVDSLVRNLAKQEQLIDPVDFDLGNITDETGMFEFTKLSDKQIEVGYNHTLPLIPQIRKLIKA